MDLFLYIWDHGYLFAVSSIPILTVYFLIKVFKLTSKTSVFVLCMMLIQSIFFWLKLKETWLIIYQCCAYISAFIILVCELISKKDCRNNEH